MPKPAVEVGRWDERGPGGPGSRTAPQTPLANLEALAWLLDSSIQVPGTNFRIGLDSIVGMVPVIGDVIGAALSTYILAMSARMGVPRVTLLRMGFNITLEAVVGLVPFAGDLFDFAWKANRRNVALLRAHVEDPTGARRGDWVFASLFLLLVIAVLALLGWAGFSLGRWALGRMAG
ncbi:MAG TPA: DUF4112 domain-containing protein [Fibrobacteria bacterium]|nr:DUF4112 domain-containing protein [Fibrobacteria bacterium]